MAAVNPFSPYNDIPPSPTSRADNYPFYDPATPGYPDINPMPQHPGLQDWSPTAPPPASSPSIHDKSELDDFINDLVRCDDDYCPHYMNLFTDTILELTRLKFPVLYTEIDKCNTEYLNSRPSDNFNIEVCQDLFQKAFEKVEPTLGSLCDARRFAVSADPLYGYNGLEYSDPFWFEHSGEIWRRTSSGSTKVTIDQCKHVRRNAEQCLLDETKPNDYCFQLYQHAIMCEPGTNCPYLRLPMVRCTYIHNQVDYQALKNCIDLLPNVERCRDGWVPVDPSDPSPIEFIKTNRVQDLPNVSV